jgi:hypothetical protein
VADNDGGSDGLDVSSALEALSAELEQAWRSGQGHQVQFGVDEISLTLFVVASGKKGAAGKIRWYVVEAGGDVSHEDSSTQTLVLTLKPVLVDPQTRRKSPLQVSGDQHEPGV